MHADERGQKRRKTTKYISTHATHAMPPTPSQQSSKREKDNIISNIEKEIKKRKRNQEIINIHTIKKKRMEEKKRFDYIISYTILTVLCILYSFNL